MDDLHKSKEGQIKNAKITSLSFKQDALQQLVLQRFQSLTTLSSIAFGVCGILISTRGGLVKYTSLAIASAVVFLLVAFISFGRYLLLIRRGIKNISKQIRMLPNDDWSEPLERKSFKADFWPEILYVILILAVMIFILALI